MEVDPSVIDALKRKMTDSKAYVPEKSLNPGQLIEIKGGPLMRAMPSFMAIFMREMSGRQASKGNGASAHTYAPCAACARC